MSSKRSRSRDKKLPSKLRMDSKPPTPRITDPSLPAGRRKEIDNVMKKARANTSPTSGAFWDKKLLEVEAKDPNRWRHSGYKSLYLDSSPSRSRSRSPQPSPRFRRSPRSPSARRVRSLRSPPSRSRSLSPIRGRRSPSSAAVRRRSPRSPPVRRPRSPPARRSLSNSSVSSCSDESCSVCSPKVRRGSNRSRSRSLSPPAPYRSNPRSKPIGVPPPSKQPHSPPPKRPRGGRPPSPASPPPQPRRMPTTPPPLPRKGGRSATNDRPTDPRRQPPPPRPRGSTGEVIDVRGVKPPPRQQPPPGKVGVKPMLLKRIKKERSGKRPGSPGGPESSGSEESRGSSPQPTPIVATTSLTLSERFGKIAQWSADRERRDLENMRITKTGGSMKVMVEEEFLYGSPPRRYSLSPVPTGHFPEKLMSSGQSRLASWDDVRVRYQYYKDLGYLRDLTLDDYIKWEEWWYKYQDWLANERHYEHWLATHGTGRRRKKRLPVSQRLN